MSPKLVVILGGNGYLGQRIVSNILKKGANVVSISRSGLPPPRYTLPSNLPSDVSVTWHKADVFDTPSWSKQLEGAEAVISCIGAFGSNDFMRKINGDANVLAVKTAKAGGVDRFVYIASSPPEVTVGKQIIPGYFEGKKKAEDSVVEVFKEKGYVLRPGFIYGNRVVPLPDFMQAVTGPTFTVPLLGIGRLLEAAFTQVNYVTDKDGNRKLRSLIFLPVPLSVDCVSLVAAMAALGEIPPAPAATGNILEVEDIKREFRAVCHDEDYLPK